MLNEDQLLDLAIQCESVITDARKQGRAVDSAATVLEICAHSPNISGRYLTHEIMVALEILGPWLFSGRCAM